MFWVILHMYRIRYPNVLLKKHTDFRCLPPPLRTDSQSCIKAKKGHEHKIKLFTQMTWKISNANSVYVIV